MEAIEEVDVKKAKRKPTYETGSYRLQVRLTEPWRQAVEEAAAKKGISASQFAREAIEAALPKRVAAKLEDVTPGRPPADE